MSRSKSELVMLGRAYGIANAEELPYRQLEGCIKSLKAQYPSSPQKVKRQVIMPVGAVRPKTPATIKALQGAQRAATTHIKRVELRKGVLRYYYVIKGGNGQVMSVSQKYFSRTNAWRAAMAIARENDYGFGVRKGSN